MTSSSTPLAVTNMTADELAAWEARMRANCCAKHKPGGARRPNEPYACPECGSRWVFRAFLGRFEEAA